VQAGRGQAMRPLRGHELEQSASLRGDARRAQLAREQRLPCRAEEVRPNVSRFGLNNNNNNNDKPGILRFLFQQVADTLE
jgi:hypothetical protein